MALFLTTILKKDLNLYENCRENKGSSVQSLPMLYVLGTLLTLCRYSAISGDEYSEQLRVRNIVGEPYSLIMHFTSDCLVNQYCLLPRIV